MTPCELLVGIPMRRKKDIKLAGLLLENFAFQFNEERSKLRDVTKKQLLRVQEENKRNFN